MGIRICVECAIASEDETCSACGRPTEEPTRESIERLVARVRESGGRLPSPGETRETEKREAERRAEEHARAEAERLRAERRKDREKRRSEADRLERERHLRKRTSERERDARDGHDDDAPNELHTIAAADAEPIEEGFRVALYENLGWFLGAFLVLAGSIYGVREAWLRLDAAGRYLVTGGACFVYHAGFLVLAWLLARRSPRTGRVLTFIALGLLPIAATTLANLARADLVLGAIAGAVFLALAFFTVSFAFRRFFIAETPHAVVFLLLAPLGAELVMPSLSGASALRFALPIAALGACVAANRLVPKAKTAIGLGVLAVIAYAAIAVEVFALTSDAAEAANDTMAWRAGDPWSACWLGAWIAALGVVFSGVRSRIEASSRGREVLRASIELGGVALSMVATFVVSLIALGDRADRPAMLVAAATALGAAAHAAHLAKKRPVLVHVALPSFGAAACVLIRAAFPAPELAAFWPLGFIAAAVAAQQWRGLAYAPIWVFVLGGFGLLRILPLEPWIDGSLPLALGTGMVTLAISSHVAGYRSRAAWHYLGAALAASIFALAASVWLEAGVRAFALIGLGAAYAVLALVDRTGGQEDSRSPFDDSSLVIWSIALVHAMALAPSSREFAAMPPVAPYLPALAAGACLYLRSFRDRSRLPALVALTGLGGLGVLSAAGVQSPAQFGIAVAAFALANIAVAAIFEDGGTDATIARSFAGRVELPFADSARRIAARASAAVALACVPIAAFAAVLWLFDTQEVDRPRALGAGVGAALVLVVGFVSRALAGFGLRGATSLLWALAPVAAICAVVNRIGRPLPPDIVGRNLTIVVFALWFVALALRRWGPAIATRLRARGSGRDYHRVPHAGVAALGLLLIVDALLVGPPTLVRSMVVTPPMMLAGGALALILLGRSFAIAVLTSAGFCVLAAAAALAGAEHLVLGPQLVAWIPPGGRWMPVAVGAMPEGRDWLDPLLYLGPGESVAAIYQRGLAGAGAVALALGAIAFVAKRSEAPGGVLGWIFFGSREDQSKGRAIWSATSGALAISAAIGAIAFWVSDPASAALVLAAAIAIAAAKISKPLVVAAPAAGVVLLHALAQSFELVPVWAGPAIAAMGALIAIRSLRARFASQRALMLALHHAVAAACLWIGAIYALAANGANVELDEGTAVIITSAAWNLMLPAGSSLALVLAVAAGSSLVAASAWNVTAARPPALGLSALGVLLAAWSGTTAAVAFTGTAGPGAFLPWTLLALICAGTVAAAHVAATVLRELRGGVFDDVASGLAVGRDLTIGAVGLLLAFASFDDRGPAGAPAGGAELGLAAIFVAVAVSVHAAFARKSALHIYFVESGVLGTYGFIRAVYVETLRPEYDALVVLGLAFLLLGVIVFARRADVPSLSAATRRFAGALPIVVALILPWETSVESAMLAGASGLFYGVLGWLENSRLFGTLGAIVANAGVLVFALSQGLFGFDIFFVPLGVCLVLLTHVFGGDLDRRARVVLRFVAASFVYAPAAIALVFQVGNAEDDMYPIIFGAGCLAGIVLGMMLHIRAYLALGTAGLCLDVVAHLVRESLRNQMLGFFLLSAAGIGILGLMVFYTLRRAAVHAWLRRWRVALRGWD